MASDFFGGGGGLWGLVGSIGGAILGWAIAITRNSTQIAALERRMENVETKMDRLTRDEAEADKDSAAALARINTTMSSIAETLRRG